MGFSMDIKSKIKSLMKEAELYRSQGLLAESKDIYENVLNIIQSRLSPQDGEKISKAITSKINALEKEINRVEKKVLSPEMNRESQDLITKMFATEEGEDQPKAEMEGAKALIKFGQFDRAKEELTRLIRIDDLRAEAAKHILNCFFLESKYDDGLKQYEQWCSDPTFSTQQIDNLKNFIQSTFNAKGIDKKIPEKDSVRNAIPFDPAKYDQDAASAGAGTTSQETIKSKPSATKETKKPVTFEEEGDEDFEEFDIMASIKKSKKSKKE